MTNSEIINKANEVVKNGNFTKLIKVRKNAGPTILIVAFGNGLGIYRSYSNSNIFYSDWENKMFRLV